MEKMTRMGFMGGLLATAGCATASSATGLVGAAKDDRLLKIAMLKLGTNNMAGDAYLTADWPEWNAKQPKPKKHHRIAAKELRWDAGVWERATKLAKRGGLNAVLIDLHEGVVYPSHPEIAVKGAWTPERLKDELKRLRSMGLEPLPKLNFSTTHAAWQGVWRKRTSSPEYYTFCADLIKDVCEIFETPRLFHLGMDEEWPSGQPDEPFVICRQGDLWFHDCKFLINEVEKHGVRAWIWGDVFKNDPEGFKRNIPKSVLISNWYYAELFDPAKFPATFKGRGYWSYENLEKAGYDQLPTGSNWCGPRNMAMTIRHCLKTIAPERLKGFMSASWMASVPESEATLLASIGELSAALEGFGL